MIAVFLGDDLLFCSEGLGQAYKIVKDMQIHKLIYPGDSCFNADTGLASIVHSTHEGELMFFREVEYITYPEERGNQNDIYL